MMRQRKRRTSSHDKITKKHLIHATQMHPQTKKRIVEISVISLILALFVYGLISYIHISPILSLQLHSIDNTSVDISGLNAPHVLLGNIDSKGVISNIHILAIDLSQNHIQDISIPENVYVQDSGSYVELQTLYAIKSLQNAQLAFQEWERDVTDSTYITIDGYILVKTQSKQNGFIDVSDSTKYAYLYTQGNILSHASLIANVLENDVYTNMNISSLQNIGVRISNLAPNQISVLRFLSGDSVQTSQGDVLQPSAIYTDITSQLVDSVISSEHARVSVYNATGIDGKADLISKLIASRGSLIDTVSTYPVQSRTVLYAKNALLFPQTVFALQHIFHAVLVKQQISLTSDISLVLGRDMSTTF